MSEIEQRAAERMEAEAEQAAVPFDLSTARVDSMLDADPPPRRWVIDRLLPLNVVALFAGAGKTGKSIALLQLAISVCTGRPWLGMNVGVTGPVLILAAEDDHEEVWRRLRAITTRMEEAGELTDVDRQRITERLRILDRVGDDNRLTARIDRELIRTGMADRIITTAAELPEIALIALDPLARFDGGDPNANDDATRLIECVEHIRRQSGATVMLSHHVGKASMRDDEAGQEAVRGASGLVDGARWVGLMQRLRRADARRYGIEPDRAGYFVRFTTPASNYAPPWDGMWLERLPGGVLVPTDDLEEHEVGEQQQHAEERYQRIRTAAEQLIRRHGPMSARHMRDNYAGAEGVMGAGQRAVWAGLRRAVEEGALIERLRADNRGHELHLPPGVE